MMTLGRYGTYGLVLYIHSIVRWLVVAAGVYAVIRTWRGRLGGRPWEKPDTLAARLFVSLLDLQLLLGVVVFTLSPAVAGVFFNPEVGMQSRGLRFWVFEHPVSAIVAIALAHVGFLKARRGGPTAHRDASLYFLFAMLIVLALIPWPIFSHGRALWPTW